MFEGQSTDRPGLDEQYITATQASDLSMDADRTGAVDHLIAAGLAGNRMGSALKQLEGEWDAADRPPKPTEEDAAFRAELVLSVLGMGHKGKPDLKRARAEVIYAYGVALKAVYMALPGRQAVLAIMNGWAMRCGVDRDLLSTSLYHHLNPTCPVCDGQGQLKMPDAPVLGKQCHACSGTGKWPRPLGADRVEKYLKSCGGRARRERGDLLRGEVTAADVTPLAQRMRGELEPDPSPEEVARLVEVFKGSMCARRNKRLQKG